MIRTSALLLSCACLFFISCSNQEEAAIEINEEGIVINRSQGLWEERVSFPVESELINEFDLSQATDSIIGSISYLSIDDSGNMYFMDRSQLLIYSFSSEGEFRWVTGGEGRGPGDLSSPFGMTIHGNKLYVGNLQGARIDEFDLNGEFIKSYNNKGTGLGLLLGINSKNEMIIASPVFGASGSKFKFISYEDSMRMNREFEVIEKEYEGLRGATIGSLKEQSGEYIYKLNQSYGFWTYNESGTKIGGMRREFDHILGTGVYAEGGSSTMVQIGSTSGPFFLENGYYLMKAEYPLNIDDREQYAKQSFNDTEPDLIKEKSIALFDEQNRLLYESTDQEFVEDKFSFSVKGPDGYFYSTETEPVPLIRKFRVSATE